VAALAWWTLASVFSDVAHLAGRPAGSALALFGAVGARMGLRLAAAAVVLEWPTFCGSAFRHARSLRMSREEVKREQKEREGDPLHKVERQRLHREILEQQIIDERTPGQVGGGRMATVLLWRLATTVTRPMLR